jgi:hypothetical protein
VTWPRLAIAFGDEGAAKIAYTFVRSDGRRSTSEDASCLRGYGESPNLHCDLGVFATAAETSITITAESASPSSVIVSLAPFNYCGDQIAQVVVTTSEGGKVEFGQVVYVDACGL